MKLLFIFVISMCILFTGCSIQSLHRTYNLGQEYAIQFSSQGAEVTPQEDVIHASQTIPSHIVQIAWNNKYIIAKQVEKNFVENHPDVRIAHSDSIHYWIIDVIHNKRFGPYTDKQLDAQKKEFRISSLQLQNVDTYMNGS